MNPIKYSDNVVILMEYEFKVFESSESKNKDPADTKRFESSLEALAKVGIHVQRIKCSSVSDIDEEEDAFEIISEEGMSALPIAEYGKVAVSVGKYPDDQTLANFLDVPNGTLSVDKQLGPNINDLGPAYNCQPQA